MMPATETVKPKRSRKAKIEAPAEIVAVKAFDKNLQCRGFQYAIGETYQHPGRIAMCSSGFHSCTDPLDVLNYYDITESRFALVKASGQILKHGEGDSKICSASLHIEAELTLPDFIRRAISAITAACTVKAKGSPEGYAKNASSGDYATNASSGHSAKNASSGHSATNASSGHSATNASSGHSATNEATGEHAVIVAAGRDSLAKGAKGVWISLAEYKVIDGNYRCVGFATGQAGFHGVPVDTWLKAVGGKLVKAA